LRQKESKIQTEPSTEKTTTPTVVTTETTSNNQATNQILDDDISDGLLKRSYRLEGATYKVKTPQGKAFITINKTPEGKPFEVFINVGKAGTDVSALSEGMGRLVSGLLRYPDSREDTVKEIISQLSGIGGSRSVGFGKNKVNSIPDAVAKVLAEEFGYNIPHTNGNDNQSEKQEAVETHEHLVETKDLRDSGVANVDMCPECGNYSFVKEEGCSKCRDCGYSVC
jgi:ribonucleoside-diphosphate reductase alpha chain